MSTTASFSVPTVAGPFFFGLIVDAILYGAVVMQVLGYLMVYKRDWMWVKAMVLFILAIETLHTGFMVTAVYKPLVPSFGNYDALLVTGWESHADPVTTAVTMFIVLCFFAWRIRALTHKIWLASALALCAFVQLVFGASATAALALGASHPSRAAILSWLGVALGADAAVVAILTAKLRGKKTVTEAGVDTVAGKLTRMTLETGLVALIWTAADLILYAALPNSSLHLVFALSLSKTHALALLAALTSRHPGAPDAGLSALRRPDTFLPVREVPPGLSGVSMEFCVPAVGLKESSRDFFVDTRRASGAGMDVDASGARGIEMDVARGAGWERLKAR